MRRLCASVLGLLLILGLLSQAAVQTASPAAGQPAAAKLSEAIEEISLPNGLRIFVLERHFSPTFAAYYRFNVGSAMDPKGKSGIAHLLEHMMFKGSQNVGTTNPREEARIMKRVQNLWRELSQELDRREDPFHEADEARIAAIQREIAALSAEHKEIIVKNEYDELMTRAGGVSMNASTGNDVTNYFLQLPANQLEFWFRVESDRLLNPVFREFYSERDVVHEERRLRTENQASGLSWEAFGAMVYHAHPYGTPVIGWGGDIERYDRGDAEDYFRTYYSPSNCIMVFVGDVESGDIQRLARKYLGRWRRQEIPRLHVTAEPEQRGERREVVEFDAEPSLMMGWPAVREGDADEYPLTLLGRLLGGMASSRLDRELVQERRIASTVSSFLDGGRYGGAFIVTGQPRGEHTVAELEAAVQAVIARLQTEGISAAELERSKVATEVRRVRRLDSNLWLAFSIGRAVGSAGRLSYLEEYEERIMGVTAEDVNRVACAYLQPSALNVVEVRRPPGAGEGERPGRRRGGRDGATDGLHSTRGAAPSERGTKHSRGFGKAMAMVEAADPVQIAIPEIGRDVERVVLPSGITVFIKEDHTVPAVTMNLTFLGGSNTTPVEDLAPFALAGNLLREGGTATLSPAELEIRLDELGMNFNCWLGGTSSGVNLWSLSRNFDESFALACEILKQPRLDTERLEVLKGQYLERMRRRYDRPRSGIRVLEQHLLTGDHPRLGRVTTKAEIEALEAVDIRPVIERYLAADNLYISVVGDFDKAAMLEKIDRHLGSWRSGADAKRVWITRPPTTKPGVYVVEKDIPALAISVVQEIAVDRSAPEAEHAAIEILNEILGGSGFRSRLMERLRSDEGLTYGIYSSFRHEGREGEPGRLSIGYQTKRETAWHSIQSVLDEYRKIRDTLVSEAEVREQIQAWRNRFVFEFENEAYSVRRLMDHELDDRPYDFDRRLLEAVQRVTIADVQAAARKYLDPSRLTIAVFGQLSAEDETAVRATTTLTKLSKDEVFKGGF